MNETEFEKLFVESGLLSESMLWVAVKIFSGSWGRRPLHDGGMVVYFAEKLIWPMSPA
jgi:hypothetical protein